MDDSGQLSQFAPLSTRRGRHGSRGGGCSRASYVEPRQSGSTEDLGLPRCLACSHARSQWSDCAGWALAERGWLGACHGCVDTLGCSSRTAESAAMVASPCRSEPSGTSIGDGPNPPSASWEMGDWALAAGVPIAHARLLGGRRTDKSARQIRSWRWAPGAGQAGGPMSGLAATVAPAVSDGRQPSIDALTVAETAVTPNKAWRAWSPSLSVCDR